MNTKHNPIPIKLQAVSPDPKLVRVMKYICSPNENDTLNVLKKTNVINTSFKINTPRLNNNLFKYFPIKKKQTPNTKTDS